MDKKDDMPIIQKPAQPAFTEKIGATTYEVTVHFSKTSKETISDKIQRLIQHDCTKIQQ